MMTHSDLGRRREAGKALGSFLLLLVLIAGGGAWNYQRNLQTEEAQGHRPYASYASEDLEALRSAYGNEVQGGRANLDQAKRNRARPQGDAGSIAGNVAQFQRATRASSAIRQAASQVASGQSQVAELDREIELRERFGEGMERHIKRLTTL